MIALIVVVIIFVLLALIAQAGKRGANQVPDFSSKDASGPIRDMEALLHAVHKEGVTLGYSRAWTHQLEAEENRVMRFLKARADVAVLHTFVAVVLASAPMAVAFGKLPMLRGLAPNLLEWQWTWVALGVFVAYRSLAIAIDSPRKYLKFQAASGELGPEFDRLAKEMSGAITSSQVQRLLEAQVRMRNEYTRAQEAGRAAGLTEGAASAAAASKEALAAAKAEGAATAEKRYQARLKEGLAESYSKGVTAGRAEASKETRALLGDAYARGRYDAEQEFLVVLRQRMQTERDDAYDAGFGDGYRKGRSEGGQTPRQQGNNFATRPRTRAQALALLELSEGATAHDVARQYRTLRAAIHPDVVRSKGLHPILIKYAEEHFKLLGEAHDIVGGVRT